MARKRSSRRQEEVVDQTPQQDDTQARQLRGDARQDAEGADDMEQVTTMICLTCGAEQFFTAEVPDELTCEKCGSTVFRNFTTPVARDDAAISALEEQARSIQYGDPSPSTTPDELRDLGR